MPDPDVATGGNNVLLYAVAAAVIGGTSLFGGRGRAIDAVIGGLVIATISNGLGLLNQAATAEAALRACRFEEQTRLRSGEAWT
ncbi:hypothetical protein [Nocardioides exalbidus]|uniref:hypothetical protein n=1 Tax=Nocardioides exalbidus TaxID=402596 RepID=UPI000B84114F